MKGCDLGGGKFGEDNSVRSKSRRGSVRVGGLGDKYCDVYELRLGDKYDVSAQNNRHYSSRKNNFHTNFARNYL